MANKNRPSSERSKWAPTNKRKQKRTSIGSSVQSRPKHKSARKGKYRGQGR